MEYKQLEFFLAVCEQKSISQAAKTCFVSQQAISKSISNLEQELGVQLFARSTSGVLLTDAGHLLEQQVRPHLTERDSILQQLRHFHAKPQLRIGFLWAFCRNFRHTSFQIFKSCIQKYSFVTIAIPILKADESIETMIVT